MCAIVYLIFFLVVVVCIHLPHWSQSVFICPIDRSADVQMCITIMMWLCMSAAADEAMGKYDLYVFAFERNEANMKIDWSRCGEGIMREIKSMGIYCNNIIDTQSMRDNTMWNKICVCVLGLGWHTDDGDDVMLGCWCDHCWSFEMNFFIWLAIISRKKAQIA